jgi:hypothetical protein
VALLEKTKDPSLRVHPRFSVGFDVQDSQDWRPQRPRGAVLPDIRAIDQESAHTPVTAQPDEGKVEPHPPRARRSRRRKREPISAPLGFGGLDGRQTFGSALVDAMLASHGLATLPSWWPLDRLSALRTPAGMRQALREACLIHLQCPWEDVLACSTDTSSTIVVDEVLRFVTAENGHPIEQGVADPRFTVSVHSCLGVNVLVLRSASLTAIVAPAMITRDRTVHAEFEAA